MNEIQILYEDEDILAVNKPAGLPMHPNLDPLRPSLVSVLQEQLARRDGEPGYLGIHQRLDLETSGTVIFTRSFRANSGMASQFETRTVTKEYLALIGSKHVPDEWIADKSIGEPIRRGGPVRVGAKSGKAAKTQFFTLQRAKKGSLVKALLLSGRKHQIRAHLSSLGFPIIGDALYGGQVIVEKHKVARVMLHAWHLALNHPVSGKAIDIKAEPPQDFLETAQIMGIIW